MLEIAIISDIHNGPDLGTKKGSSAPLLLQNFIDFVGERKPDCIVDLGDRVNHVDPKTDLVSLKQVAGIFQKISFPIVHIMGNHDVDFLLQEENEKVLGCSFSSHQEERNGYSLLYWNADVHMHKEHGMTLRDADLQWLSDALDKASYPAVIFSHVPLNNGSMLGNFYFDTYVPKKGQYPKEQGERVRAMIEESGKVIACINGHAHWNAYGCIDGVHYITLPSLTETFMTYPEPHSAWTWLRLAQESIEIEIFGKTPMKYSLPVRESSRHWININNDYSPIKIVPK